MDIVQEIRENRERGADRLESEYRDRLLAVAVRVCGDSSDAESYVTQTFAEVIEHIETLTNPDSFFSWMCSILVNIHAKAKKRKEHERVVYTDDIPEQVIDGAGQVLAAVDAEILRDAIRELPKDMRESLLLHYFMDMPVKKVARILSVPVGTVMSRLYYARIFLGRRLGAKLKKSSVAMIAAGLMLLGAMAAVVVDAVSARNGNSEEMTRIDPSALDSSAMNGALVASSEVPALPSVSYVPFSGTQQQTTDNQQPFSTNQIENEKGVKAMKRTSIVASFKKLMNGMTAVAMMSMAANGAENDPYIESAGSTGMDTGYHMKPSTRLEFDFALTDADQSAQGRVLASYQQETGTGCSLYITSSKTWGVGIGSGSGSNWAGHWVDFPAGSKYYAPVDTIRHQVVYDLPNDRLVFATGNVTNWTHTTTKAPFAADAVYSLGLFAWPTTAAAMYSDPSKVRIYGLKIYEAGELVHDFEPCMMDGLAGFRDGVTGKFIAGGKDPGSFTAGGDYATYESPYVATPSNNYGDDQGSLYIDTQYVATQNTRCELDYAVRTALPSDINGYYLFCGYGSTWYEVSINKNGFVCHNGGGWKVNILPTIAKDVGIRHTAVLDNVNDTLSILTAGCTNGTVSTVSSGNYNTYTVKLAARYELLQDFAPIKIYGFRIYEAGELVRNFMPCSQDGVIGLKDAVTGLFVSYPPAKRHETVKSLEYGGEIAVVADPYIEGSGVNGPYIVTDYKPCGTTRAEIDFAQTLFDSSAGHYPFSIHATGTAFSFGVYTFASTQTYGYNCNDGNPKWHHSGMPTQTLARTTLILDAKNGKYYAAEARGAVTNKTFNIDDVRTATTRSQYFLPVFASRQNTGVSDEAGGGSNPYPAESRMPMKLYSFRLFEDDVLVRDYVPAVKDGVAGLQDRLPGGKFLAPATGTFAYGGAFPVEVEQSAVQIASKKTATLTAFAPGATSYRWLKNGMPMGGGVGANGTLTVAWRNPRVKATDAYQAVARYTSDGVTAESEPSSNVTVEYLPMGTIFSFR